MTQTWTNQEPERLDPLGFWARQTPEHPALVFADESWDYARLSHQTRQLAAHWSIKGYRPPHRVAICLPNGVEFVLAYFACLHAGLTAVPVNPELPAETRRYILEVSRPDWVIDTPGLILASLADQEALPFATTQTTLATIFFTSGTTGRPKGVCHTASALIDNVLAFNTLTKLDRQCRMLHVLPMGYMAGYLNTLLSVIVAGGMVVLDRPFSAGSAIRFWQKAQQHQINSLWLTPTMLSVLTHLSRGERVPLWTRQHLTHLFVGTAPLSPSVAQAFTQLFGVRCLESYGMSEALLVAANGPHHPPVVGTPGRLLDATQILLRPHAQIQAQELHIASPYLMIGYLNPQNGQPEPIPVSTLPTGDLGYLDDEQRLFITGRIKDLIIHGGTNVSPQAVEECLLQHPGIKEVAVIGLPHPVWGEEVMACLVLLEGWESTHMQTQLPEYCKERLPTDALPTRLEFLLELPRNTNGKVLKNQLREQFK